jgi:hypothetical protein
VWPSSTVDGLRLARRPDRDARILAAGGDPAVREKATAFTAPSWKRSTCSAAFFGSDQRIAEVSKLPESACAAVGRNRERAAPARHGRATAPAPLWQHRSKSVQKQRDADIIAISEQIRHPRAHAERADFLAHVLVAQRGEERLHRRALAAAFDQQEIVVLGRDREKPRP